MQTKEVIILIFNQLKKTFSQVSDMMFLLYTVIKQNVFQFIIKLIIMVYSSVMGIVPAYLVKIIIDDLRVNKEVKVAVLHIIVLAGVGLIAAMIQILLSYFDSKFTEVMKNKLEQKLCHAIMSLPYEKAESPETKEFIMLAFQGNESIMSVFEHCMSFVQSFIQFVMYFSLFFVLNPILIGVIVICAILRSVFQSRRKNKVINRRKTAVEYFVQSRVLSRLFMRIEYGKEIRMLNISHWLMNKFRCAQERENQMANEITHITQLSAMKIEIMGHLETFAAYIIIAWEVFRQHIGIGEFYFYFNCVSQISGALNAVVKGFTEISENLAFMEEFKKCILWSEEIEKTEKVKHTVLSDIEIQFVNVSFKYPESENYVLKNVSFTIKNGEKVSLVGENGAGKTTIIKLLCGFYHPESGMILINGIPLEEINRNDYYRQVGAVFQDFRIYGFSVKENIAFADQTRDVLPYLEKVGLAEKLKGLPDGIDTFMSKEFCDNGVEFSGGEAQKVAFARALYKNPAMLILDEPTAALDPLAEYEIYRNFRLLSENKTTVFISHHLASSKFVDKIIVLDQGKIAEQGSHEELMALNGKYAELFNLQAQKYC